MADVHTPSVRSYNMSKIKGKNTRPELRVRKFLHANGFRFRLYDKRLPGTPDIILPKYKTIVFVNGCFWHGHENCKYFVVPKTRTEWWKDKIVQNKKADNENYAKLTEMGWKVIIIFECKLKREFRTNTLNELVANIY
ncbi:MAG TPA: very short patch repair endonuclease [Bacteroidales bacterium]|nr:very short patch repair endonuclease [Bacteroidales bacterium]